MINKKGTLVLRDVIFMTFIVSSIFIFAGLFVSDMANNYENDNMSDEWALTKTNTIANSTFYDTSSNLNSTGDGMGGGIFDLIGGGLKAVGDILVMVITAPNTITDLIVGTLIDMGVPTLITTPIKYLVLGILWGIVIFTIGSAFLQGGKL